MLKPDIPVGGRLRCFYPKWEQITNDQWVLDVIKNGYKFEFLQMPSFNGIKENKLSKEKLLIIQQEVKELLQKGAIEPVPQEHINQGFYSTLFLVPKKTGELRPVINLRPLNRYIKHQHFKMDTMKSVMNLVRQGDYAITLDLKDAYLHIPIHQNHKKYLRFSVANQQYQFTALPFGPTSAPRTFTKVTAVIAAYVRRRGLRLAVYLDDWLGLNAMKTRLLQDRTLLITLLAELGFIINTKKSQMIPKQEIAYIGGLFKLQLGVVTPTLERLTKLSQAIQVIQAQVTCTALEYLQLLGLMASCIQLVPNARLHMRPVQLHLLYFWKPSSKDLQCQIPRTEQVVNHLVWWLQPENILKGQSVQQWTATQVIQTDASLTGYGACLDRHIIQGIWSQSEKRLHINCLEMKAVHIALQKFMHLIKGQNVLIRSDNITVVQYINKQGGTRSPPLCYLAWNLWQLALQNKVSLKAAHIAGKLNVLPDQLSRIKIRPTEWTMHRSIVYKLFQLWGEPNIDLFASIHNRQTEVFCTWIPHQYALAVDALTISWEGMYAYAFPPICLIPRVLQQIQQSHCKVILITPFWPRRPWFPQLLELSVDHPRKLPAIPQLLQQPQTQIFHPNPEVFCLTAWLLSTDVLLQRNFLKRLENYCQPVGEQEPKRTMHINSNDSIAGVQQGKLIHLKLL